jgi:hypothetical protein
MKALPFEAALVVGYLVGDQYAERELVANWAHEQSGRVLVVAPTFDRARDWANLLKEESLNAVVITRDSEWPESSVGIGAPDTVKGLECDAVWMVDCTSEFYPASGPNKAFFGEANIRVAAARRLYMAASRSARSLTISAVQQATPLLQNESLGIQWQLWHPRFPGWIPSNEVALLVGVPVKQIEEWVASKAWPGKNHANAVYVPEEWVNNYLTLRMSDLGGAMRKRQTNK